MNRGDVVLAEVGGKRRPVLVLTRPEVIDVRSMVTVAEITTQARGLAAEVDIDHDVVGLERASVINCDGIHTMAQTALVRQVGNVDEATMQRVCRAVRYALAC